MEAKGFREAVDAMRRIGEKCIEKRIQDIKNEEETPDDILTHILQSACKNMPVFLTLDRKLCDIMQL